MISKRIKQLRQEKHLNQKELSKLLNISNTTLSQYETGQRVPSDEIKIQFAKIFDCSLDYLMGVSDVRNPYESQNEPSVRDTDFSDPEEALKFILEQPTLMAYGGYDLETMSDDDILDIANDLLYALRLSVERRKKK